MMYNNKVAVALKVNGKVLREFKDTVYVPFGSEYTILIKNLNTRRAIFNIFIDGDNIVPNGLVLNAGQEIELERAIRNGNLNEGNRFKFIERTGNIEQYRGIKLEDGLIRIEYQFEQEYPKPVYPNHGLVWTQPTFWDHSMPLMRSWTSSVKNVTLGTTKAEVTYPTAADSMMIGSTLSASAEQRSFNAAPQNDVGITVPGSKSDQKFKTVSGFSLDPEKHSMIIKLLGETADNKPIVAPVTVKTKTKCQTCGKQNKATAKFCSECGTALEIIA